MPSSNRPGTGSMSAVSLLGGESALHAVPRTSMDWIVIVRQGLPAVSIDALVRLAGIPQRALARALGIPERTLLRRKRAGKLSPDESAKLVRFARVVERAVIVFDSADSALNWLKAPNVSLGGVTPLSLLDTEIGGGSVLDTLGRIEQGLFV